MAIRVMALWFTGVLLLAPVAEAGLAEMAERFTRMGRDALNARDWTGCIENLEQAVELDEENLDVLLDLAYCQQNMEVFEEAAETYALALELAPDDRQDEIRKNQAFCMSKSGKLGDAVGLYRQACEDEPESKSNWVNYGHALRGTDSPDEAIVAFMRAVELDPSDAQLLQTTADLCAKQGMPEQAVALYEKWVAKEPDNATALRHLSAALTDVGSCERGLEVFDQLLAIDSENAGDFLNAGTLAARCKQPAKATQYWDSYKEMRPNDTGVICRILYVKEDLGQALDGINTAKEALAQNPDEACIAFFYGRLLDLRGQQLQGQGKFDDAISRFREAIGKFQRCLGDSEYGPKAKQQIERAEQLIIRAERLKMRAAEGLE